jgi:hypothetical protein
VQEAEVRCADDQILNAALRREAADAEHAKDLLAELLL